MILSELIMTRISHDLAGIVGALYNTTELIEIDPSFGTEAGPLLKNSTATLMARLKFFRALFGTNKDPIQTSLTISYLKTLSAPFELIGDVTTKEQMAGVLICTDMMIRGGQIIVSANEITGIGQIKNDDSLQFALDGRLDNIAPKLAPVAWLARQTAQTNKQLTAHIQDDKISFSF